MMMRSRTKSPQAFRVFQAKCLIFDVEGGTMPLSFKQANACLSEPFFCSAAATVPAGLD